MASLHARHSRTCPLNGKWTAVPARGPIEGCECQPTFYTAARDENGKLVRERVGRKKQDAQRARDKISVQVDEGSYVAQKNIAFNEWGPKWLEALERKQTSINGYRSTIAYASAVFGHKPVRRLGTEDIARFNRRLAEIRVRRPDGNGGTENVPLSASTRAKHLRVLGACLNSAIKHKYAASNPVKELPSAEQPRPQRKESAYFTDDELPRLIAEVTPGVIRTLFLSALKTGMREGELIALEWPDLDLIAAVARVRRTCTDGIVHEPKNHERRDVDLTPEVVEMLGAWWGELGRPDTGHVFPGDGRDGYLVNGTILKRELYPAMKRAGIPRVGPTGEKRTFHSFRHTFARIALENGAELTWLSRHLGHSSTVITDSVYGHWSRTARKQAMERLADAFAF
jgi:integrase